MRGKLLDWDDTIVALATPPGVSAIGVIRLSGKESIGIVNKLFPSKDLNAQPSHTLHVGLLRKGDILLDEVVVLLYKTPSSYSGEDIVEISCHGSPFVQQQVLQALLDGGARLAKHGEFTQRAFLNGKLDLIQAESVADLIASNTEASQKNALLNIRGGFSHALTVLREQLLKFSALVELELDFSQEDVEFADRSMLNQLVNDAEQQAQLLLASFKLGNVIKNGVQVAIVGKPNAGKSTLLNTLLNENRAIVSEIAGTTRDTIEEVLNIEGIAFRLIDTAGIREHTADSIERIGVERTMEKMGTADIVLYLFDAAEDPQEINIAKTLLENQGRKFILVANKIDLVNDVASKFISSEGIIFISAREKLRIAELKRALVQQVLDGNMQAEGAIITNSRHYHALLKVARSLQDIQTGLTTNLPGDLLASDIRTCLHYLSEITGEITSEDQLDYIFSKFCIGK